MDRETYEKYQCLPASPLRTLIVESIEVFPPGTPAVGPGAGGGATTANFAKIRLNDSHRCPILSEAGLCRIHAELGVDYLSPDCATYPRVPCRTGDIEEHALTLSCPEAARLVLLNPDLLAIVSEDSERESVRWLMSGSKEGGATGQHAWFWRIRKSILKVIRNRSYPLWQRLFLLGILCKRLDSIRKGEMGCSIPDFLRDFDSAVIAGSLRNAMGTLPVDHERQLDLVLSLSGLLLNRSLVSPRFADCVHAFTTGIGNSPEATLATLTDRYEEAHKKYYLPFFSRYPHMLENYLVNTIIRCQFPFGREAMRRERETGSAQWEAPTMTHEFVVLVAQCALMKGLLIGVAGFHRERFGPVHVVYTVQTASRHFEHHPEFLRMAYTLLVENHMDTTRGLTILIRNGLPAPGHDMQSVALQMLLESL